MESSLESLCGRLIVGGFSGTALPQPYESALAAGRRGGAILFSRNVGTMDEVAAICASIQRSARRPLIAVDQEGGRVARLKAPVLELPPMRRLGELGDTDLIRRVFTELGRQLSVLGFNLDFAPVLDVDSNPDNPVIGDRALSSNPNEVARLARAAILGLQASGVAACGKHFPGHGDTDTDSHLALPVLAHDMQRLRRVEWPPFQAAAEARVASIMTAHVRCDGVDSERVATLSPVLCKALRDELGFRGVIVSDDLEMKAVADHMAIEEAAVEAIAAGCDLLLICSDWDAQERALEALVRRAEHDAAFRVKCQRAYARIDELATTFPARPPAQGRLPLTTEATEAVARELREKLGSAS